MYGWTRGEYLELAGIVVSGFIAIAIYLLQRRLSDKQRVENRLEVEEKARLKLYDIQYKDHSSKIQLYNSKLLNKKYFSQNKRDIFWGCPYHAAELYSANFDGLEFVVGIQEWNKKKYYKVGVIPYENVLGIRPEGDGSFNGMIIYVKPRLVQRDKFSIAYKSFRYYPAKSKYGGYTVTKPLRLKVLDVLKQIPIKIRYHFYYKWKQILQKRNMS